MIQARRPPPQALTVGSIARETNSSLHQVEYVLKTRPYIQPTVRAGRLRVFDRPALDAIRRELQLIAEKRRAR
jgi:hypothetical protein